MASLNRVILVGILGAEPESKLNSNGKPYTTLNLATHRFSAPLSESDKPKETTHWHRVRLWGKSAERAQAHCKKGMTLMIEGYLDTYTTESEGKKQKHVNVVADRIQFLRKPTLQNGKSEMGQIYSNTNSAHNANSESSLDEVFM